MGASGVTREERFRLVIETARDAFVAIDADGRIIEWNTQAERSFGWLREEVIGRRLADTIIPERDRDALVRGLEQFRRTGEGPHVGRRIEMSALRRDGGEFPVEMTMTAAREESGWSFNACLHDISERKTAEAGLREREQELHAIFDGALDALVICDDEGRCVEANPAACALLGVSRERLLASGIRDFVPPAADVEAAWKAFLQAGRLRGDWRIVRPDGSVRDVEVAAVAHFLPGRHRAAMHDVTAQKRAEAALRESERRHRLLFESSPVPMWVYDRDTWLFLAVNDAAVQRYGYSREEFLAMTVDGVRPPEEVPALQRAIAGSPRGQVTGGVWTHRKKDGTLVDVEVFGQDLAFEGRDARLVVANDVTVKRRAERAVRVRSLQRAAVAQLGQRALGGLDLDALMSEAVALVTATLNVDACEVVDVVANPSLLRLRAGFGWKPGVVGQATLPAGAGSHAGYALLTKSAVVSEDLAREGRFAASPLTRANGVISGACVIIGDPERPFGVLGAYASRRPRRFSEDDMSFLQAVANVLATATLRKREEEARRLLLERVMEAQEQERRRIARELHDEAGQQLTSLLVRLGALDRAPSPRPMRAEMRNMRKDVSRLIDDLGRLARGLNPSILNDLGLATALRRHAEEQSRALGIAVQVAVDGLGRARLARPVETSLYRVAQEALANAARHGRARHVDIRLRRDAGAVTLSVEDDGKGFDVPATLLEEAADRLGLHGIVERASLMGGSATIDSRPGAGTKVVVRIPLPARKSRRPGRTRPGPP